MELEPGPAVMLVEGEGLRDVYELGVTADMTLLTEALQESSPTRSWVESQMVQLRAATVTAASEAQTAKSDAEGAAAVAEGHRTHVDSIRDLLDEAAQTNVAPYLTETALKATYGAKGAGVARAMSRARAGQNLHFTCVGDSIFDTTTPGNAGGGPMEKTATLVASRFGIEVTTANHAQSGYTAARSALMGRVTSAIAEKADVLFISFGKNDINSQTIGPFAANGYPMDASLAQIERICATVRRDSPRTDLVIIGEGPYAPDTAANVDLVEYETRLRAVAAAWGAEFVDAYAAFEALGNWAHLMYDGTHQNPAGNDLYAQTILGHLTDKEFAPVALAAPPKDGLWAMSNVAQVGEHGWVVVSGAGTKTGTTVTYGGAGWASGATSTPGDTVTIAGVGTEVLAQVSTALANNAVVDVLVDGVVIGDDVHLADRGLRGDYWLPLAVGLTPAAHTVVIRLVSGTLRHFASAVLAAATSTEPHDQITLISSTGTALALPEGGTDLILANAIPVSLPAGWQSANLTIVGRVQLTTAADTTTVRDVRLLCQVSTAKPTNDSDYTYETLLPGPTGQQRSTPLSTTRWVDRAATVSLRVRLTSADKTGVTVTGSRVHAVMTRAG
ncbi:SGNH/GDSL hydrolase family protein [Dietzia cercidiphylli]|uniref:SGNH/GDSL hydrolase family protein n=1 Tax=Dietzia cercidiphylli TaxID=498199 RepID=UPI0031E032E8